MLQSQGPRAFEPYRILQVQPHASQELVVEAYWTLVARAKAHQNEAAMRALNAAYELLTNADRRAAYDREHGYLRARSRRPTTTSCSRSAGRRIPM
jgi:curved DNA-binding protein CbpA